MASDKNAILILMNQKGLVPIVILVVVALIIGVGVVKFSSQHNTTNNLFTAGSKLFESTPSSVENTIDSALVDETKDWSIYVNSKDKYSFKYPKDWYVKACGYGQFEGSNIFLNDKPLKDDYCLPSESPPTEIAKVSLALSLESSVEDAVKEATKMANIAIDVHPAKTNIGGKEYTQIIFHIKLVPPFFEFSWSDSTTTLVPVPEINKILTVGLTGKDDGDKDSQIYRKIISSITQVEVTDEKPTTLVPSPTATPKASLTGSPVPTPTSAPIPTSSSTTSSAKPVLTVKGPYTIGESGPCFDLESKHPYFYSQSADYKFDASETTYRYTSLRGEADIHKATVCWVKDLSKSGKQYVFKAKSYTDSTTEKVYSNEVSLTYTHP